MRDEHDARRRRRNRIGALAMLLVLAGTGAWLLLGRPAGTPLQLPSLGPDETRAPEGVRIKVEVLNATRTRGLARRATRVLRDRGFDVVGVGTESAPRDSTLVLDRSNNPQWASLVAEALGGARVESRPDSSRYLDVTVLLGSSWRPPPEAFYP